ncbi:MAG: class I SAM-dependent methyltransferase [Acidobacteriota bacterium]|nr:class I SAM-dependent methyltransferase [Acidobacteriota bacterium]
MSKETTASDIYSDYDRFAWFYNRYWGPEFSLPALAIYNVLLFPHLPAECRVLDLCCGTGQISAGLSERGFRVTGLDGSEAMLRFARQNAPAAEFIHGDARLFRQPQRFQCVISAFDSLNHIMELDELTKVFRNVYDCLSDDGIFLFDLNIEDASELLGSTLDMIEDDHVCIVRGSYNQMKKLKRYEVTMFQLEDRGWQRADLTLYQRYYSTDEVLGALADAGFLRVKTYDARREFDFNLSDGRMFYLARK